MKIVFKGQHSKVQQVADAVRTAIIQGIFEEGNSLPSINQISDQSACARDTVFKAYQLLKAEGIIQSEPMRGYYVATRIKRVLVLLDIFSPYKNDLYVALTKHIGAHHRLDLYFHHYNETHFESILQNSVGKYSKFLVMNLHHDRCMPILNTIDADKLLFLDFGNFEKNDRAYVMQDFDAAFYSCMVQAAHRFTCYKRLCMVFPRESRHPRSCVPYFHRFCDAYGLEAILMEDGWSEADICADTAYLWVSHADLIDFVKVCRKNGLRIGQDVGAITFNDAPMLEVIERGISSISVDFKEMGTLAARFIVEDQHVQATLQTHLILRGSL
ncbi:MAG: GntR family transcriptional regulator [Bacteroidales bacterium]|jgi:DNA-binding transcriptional regulator YhcF (GntR family)|nr:GntR family transcriptional regulator [Bacteroidales bacterium]